MWGGCSEGERLTAGGGEEKEDGVTAAVAVLMEIGSRRREEDEGRGEDDGSRWDAEGGRAPSTALGQTAAATALVLRLLMLLVVAGALLLNARPWPLLSDDCAQWGQWTRRQAVSTTATERSQRGGGGGEDMEGQRRRDGREGGGGAEEGGREEIRAAAEDAPQRSERLSAAPHERPVGSEARWTAHGHPRCRHPSSSGSHCAVIVAPAARDEADRRWCRLSHPASV